MQIYAIYVCLVIMHVIDHDVMNGRSATCIDTYLYVGMFVQGAKLSSGQARDGEGSGGAAGGGGRRFREVQLQEPIRQAPSPPSNLHTHTHGHMQTCASSQGRWG